MCRLPGPEYHALVKGGTERALEKALELAGQGKKVCLISPTVALVSGPTVLNEEFEDHNEYNEKLKELVHNAVNTENITIFRNAIATERKLEGGGWIVVLDTCSVYVDEDRCDDCGDCAAVCPVSILDAGAAGLIDTHPIAYPNRIMKELKFGIRRLRMPYCQASCPIHMDVRGYVGSLAGSNVEQANEIIADTNPLPLICGTVCTHPCEVTCARGYTDEPLHIRALKRYAVSSERWAVDGGQKMKEDTGNTEPGNKVAVIGAGPAGITAARELSSRGYPITLFDALGAVGGMLWAGIPNFRLSEDVVKSEIQRALPPEVELKLDTAIGKSLTISDLMTREGFKAVFVAAGAHDTVKLRIPGEDSEGVVSGMEFLRNLNMGNEVSVGKKVAVIGGGNVAVDAARAAVRLGAEEVTILYRRSRAEMPAYKEEIEEAEEEGVRIELLTAPVKILDCKGPNVAGVECVKMELGEPDASGRRRPMPVAGTEHVVDADTVITAVGQVVRPDLFDENLKLKLKPDNSIVVDARTCATSVPGVFAGGDAARGPASVIEAIADGKRAAIGIDAYIRGVDIKDAGIDQIENRYYYNGERTPSEMTMVRLEKHFHRLYSDGDTKNEKRKTSGLQLQDVMTRIKSFEQVEHVLSDEQAALDAARCYGCRLCIGCGLCRAVCAKDAIDYTLPDRHITIETETIYDLKARTEKEILPALKELYRDSYNVITASELEAMLDPGGAFSGMIIRPYDGDIPNRILFVHIGKEEEGKRGGETGPGLAQLGKLAGYVANRYPHIEVKLLTDTKELGTMPEGYEHLAGSLEDLKDAVVEVPDLAVEEDAETKRFTISYTAEGGKERSQEYDLLVISSVFNT